jgi:hypothetical protein
MSDKEEVYTLNLDSPVAAYMQFYWFLSLLESGADTRSTISETEQYFRQVKHYNVPILMDISRAQSKAVIACPFSTAACQMFETNKTAETIFCIYNVEGEDDTSREASYYPRAENIHPGCIIVSIMG